MTKAAAKQEPELFATPADKQPKARTLTEGPNRKGGRNPTTQIKERPPAPGAISKKHEIVVHQPQPPAQPKSLLQVIAEAASNPAVDVQKMKELLAIQKDMEAREAEREFTIALAAAQAEMPRIAKDAKSDKHKYARLETVTKTLDPIIAKHHFSLSFGMSDSPIIDHYRITATLAHKGGHKREYFIDLPADTKGAKGNDNKTQVQGIGSTISYGRRYLTVLIFNIAITNEDDDGRGGKPSAALLFQQAFRVQAVEDLPAIRRPTMSEIEIIDDVLQGSPEWDALRLGVPTASCFAQVMAQGDGKVRSKYMRILAGERMSGVKAERFRSAAMERGSAIEPELRALFAIETGLPLRQVGFVRRTMEFGVVGASPDSLVGDDAGVELKSMAPDLLIELLQVNRLPSEHLPQLQGNMLVSGRSCWWLGIGFPGLPMFKARVKRDTAYCARLEVGLRAFVEELDEMVRWLKQYGRD